jgi:hypothetical protein
MTTTMEGRITPLTYATEIVAMSWRHGGELAVTLGGTVAICLTALATLSRLQPGAIGGAGHVLRILATPIAAAFLFQAVIAGWRLHRRMGIVLATTRSLLDATTRERDGLEQHMLSRSRRREHRIHERNEARIERLDDEIAELTRAATS